MNNECTERTCEGSLSSHYIWADAFPKALDSFKIIQINITNHAFEYCVNSNCIQMQLYFASFSLHLNNYTFLMNIS